VRRFHILAIAVAAIGLVVIGSGSARPAAAATCQDGTQASGAVYRICMPASWNGDLVIWAHGYVDPREPVAIPEGQLVLPDGTSIVDIATGLNFAFATTSYRFNGLVVPWGVQDVVDLVQVFEQQQGPADAVILIGASEGGLVTALALENYPNVFDGGIAVCGPVGDFRSQVRYFGDFRVVFNYFFPGVIPGSTVEIPQEVIDNWDSAYVPAIDQAIINNPHAAEQLINVTKAAVDPNDLSTVRTTIMDLLWYNVHATNDGVAKLYGNPFDNMTRVYSGSDNDAALNAGVQRFAADPIPLQAMNIYFQTTGRLSKPLVTLHTKGDQIVPAYHEDIYYLKTIQQNSFARHVNISVDRYGHCNVQPIEALYALLALQLLKIVNPN
jgi:pimeloyl-ACP methyl ester carboxylesterase